MSVQRTNNGDISVSSRRPGNRGHARVDDARGDNRDNHRVYRCVSRCALQSCVDDGASEAVGGDNDDEGAAYAAYAACSGVCAHGARGTGGGLVSLPGLALVY